MFQAAEDGVVTAVKWYPAGATTNSDAGVKETEVASLLPTLKAMAEVANPSFPHGDQLAVLCSSSGRSGEYERHGTSLTGRGRAGWHAAAVSRREH
jgi:hypothetical protein